MIEVVPYKAEHVKMIDLQDNQKWLEAYLTDELATSLEGAMTYTAMVMGQPVLIGGLQRIWEGRYLVWCYLAKDAKKHLVGLTKKTLRLFEMVDARRIEAFVDCDFHEGHRWIKILGFKLEAERMRSYTVDGRDCSLYARIKE